MKISTVIHKLQKIQEEYGDLYVIVNNRVWYETFEIEASKNVYIFEKDKTYTTWSQNLKVDKGVIIT